MVRGILKLGKEVLFCQQVAEIPERRSIRIEFTITGVLSEFFERIHILANYSEMVVKLTA